MPKIRVRSVGAVVTTSNPSIRVRSVGAVTGYPTSFTVSASASVTTALPAQAGSLVTLTATASPNLGDPIIGYVWTPRTPGTDAVTSPASAVTTVRIPALLTSQPVTWQVVATAASGVTATASVTVTPDPARFFMVDSLKMMLPAVLSVHPPTTTPPPPPDTPHFIRVRGVGAIVADPTVVTPPPPPPPDASNTVLVGARFRYPGASSVTQDFNSGEADYGVAQVTKDYVSGTSLPKTYNPPFPGRVRIILSLTKDIDYNNDPNFKTFIKSVPTGTILTWQHEPERPTFSWTAAQYVTQLNAFRRAVRAVRTDLPVWLISSAFQYRNNGGATDGSWFQNLTVDGYGLDGYRSGQAASSSSDPLHTYVNNAKPVIPSQRQEFTTWKSFVPSGMPWGLTEFGVGWVGSVYDPKKPNVAGTTVTIDADRITCTKASLDDVQKMGGSIFLYFISGQGPDGNNWMPVDDGFKTMYTALPRATSSPLLP